MHGSAARKGVCIFISRPADFVLVSGFCLALSFSVFFAVHLDERVFLGAFEPSFFALYSHLGCTCGYQKNPRLHGKKAGFTGMRGTLYSLQNFSCVTTDPRQQSKSPRPHGRGSGREGRWSIWIPEKIVPSAALNASNIFPKNHVLKKLASFDISRESRRPPPTV